MQTYKISINNAKEFYSKLDCDTSGISILSKKSKLHTLYIKDLHVSAANILKQDALSIGADLAIPNRVIITKNKYVDAILIGSTKHFEVLSRKELAQPFGLKALAKRLKDYIKETSYKTKIMGVLNANEDSFFTDSRFSSKEAACKIENMIENGANIIDIGAISSRPGSIAVNEIVELERLKNIVDIIYKERYFEKVDFSIDSYSPLVIDYVLNKGFKIVNDITGLENDEVCKISAKYNAKVIIMHMQNKPSNMQEKPEYENVILDVNEYFKKQIEKANSFGIKDITLDVGIGFGKNLDHNLLLLNNLEHFKHFGCELLIGASRKSIIDMITPCEIRDRLPGTLAIHLEAVNRGASIIRCHDIYEHYQALKVQEAINSVN